MRLELGIDVRLAAILDLLGRIPGLEEDAACVLQVEVCRLWNRSEAERYIQGAMGRKS